MDMGMVHIHMENTEAINNKYIHGEYYDRYTYTYTAGIGRRKFKC